ncbi:unnamed protein product [Caenorhabditis bovis]|uniref:CHK kinase-like domain-containing protein n=1 Tax=Caenorhabditis bovis TaxID=2654633 RepID=A0A8S1E7Q7_9PELO|nr:unnamed protein product [Caenorhabditis bovis]
MSLSVAAHGILKTHLTWDEVEHELQKAFNTKAHFGPNKSATSISDFKGFMSKIALIEPDWQNVATDENLPEKFIVKISSQLAFVELRNVMKMGTDEQFEKKIKQLTEVTRKFHNHEVESYRLLEKYAGGEIAITKIFATRKFDSENQLKGFIISEYIPDTQHIPLYESISYEDIQPIVKAAALFSAVGENMLEDELEYTKDHNMASIIGKFLDEENLNNVVSLLKEKFPTEHEDKIDEYFDIIKRFYAEPEFLMKYAKMHTFLRHKPVLIHCDLWSSNLLCTKSDDHHVKLKAIIDFQTVSTGSPGIDLGRLFTSSLTAKDRREHLDDLLHLYYSTFIGKLAGKPQPYNFTQANSQRKGKYKKLFLQLKISYNIAFPLLTLLVIPAMTPLLEQANVPENLRETMREAAIEKMVGLLEDAIETHKRNVEEIPEFYN